MGRDACDTTRSGPVKATAPINAPNPGGLGQRHLSHPCGSSLGSLQGGRNKRKATLLPVKRSRTLPPVVRNAKLPTGYDRARVCLVDYGGGRHPRAPPPDPENRTMNNAIWIIGLIALGAVIFFLARSTDDGGNELQAPPPLPSPQPKKPEFTVEQIQCPACDGYGYVMERTGTASRKRRCQLCAGKGGKVLRIPPGHVRCPDCQGFGRIQGPKRYLVCPRCNARGYIKEPFRPNQ